MQQDRRTLLKAAVAGSTGLLAGCAGASGNRRETETTTESMGGTTTEAMEGTTTAGDESTPFTVQVTTHPDLGVILTDGEGMTLYLFTRDSEGESVCYDDCASAWPPLTVDESATVPDGLPGAVGTTERRDGSVQVTYNGMPLYYFQNDRQPGDVSGQGVGDVWFVVNPTCEGGATADAGTTTTDDTTATESDGGGTNY